MTDNILIPFTLYKDYDGYLKEGQKIIPIAEHAQIECEIYGVKAESGYWKSKEGFKIVFIKKEVFLDIKNNYSK